MTTRSTIPALCTVLKDWFPDFGGRVLAVSEAEVTPENMPTLPLVMVALQKLPGKQGARSNAPPRLTEDILIQFWVKPERYRLASGAESPFWSYYDYDAVLDVLLTNLADWKTPRGTKLAYEAMDIEADQFAVVLTFRVTHEYEWCVAQPAVEVPGQAAAKTGDGAPFTLNYVSGAPPAAPPAPPAAPVIGTEPDPGSLVDLYDLVSGTGGNP